MIGQLMRVSVGTRAAGVLVCATLAGHSPALAAECPEALRHATRLLVATTPGQDVMIGRIALFERSGSEAKWRRAGTDVPMVAGLKGLAWGWTAESLSRTGERVKREGDKRTPAGVFRLGRPFGHSSNVALPGYFQLRKSATFCVDDVRSPHYGTIVPRSTAGQGVSGEDMAEYGMYRRGIVIDYPPNAAKQAGSCIFIHVWRRADRGTAGCVATDEPSVKRLQRFTAGQPSAIAILPQMALGRLKGCLPQ